MMPISAHSSCKRQDACVLLMTLVAGHDDAHACMLWPRPARRCSSSSHSTIGPSISTAHAHATACCCCKNQVVPPATLLLPAACMQPAADPKVRSAQTPPSHHPAAARRPAAHQQAGCMPELHAAHQQRSRAQLRGSRGRKPGQQAGERAQLGSSIRAGMRQRIIRACVSASSEHASAHAC